MTSLGGRLGGFEELGHGRASLDLTDQESNCNSKELQLAMHVTAAFSIRGIRDMLFELAFHLSTKEYFKVSVFLVLCNRLAAILHDSQHARSLLRDSANN